MIDDEERARIDRIEYEAFYAEENTKKVIAGIFLVAIILGLVFGALDVIFDSPSWLNWIRP